MALLLTVPPPGDMTRLAELPGAGALILSVSHPICNAHDRRVGPPRVVVVFVFSRVCVCGGVDMPAVHVSGINAL